ncbi:heavy metal translocating P-type ATPase [Orbaceae bacterium ac157xtp]
MSINNHSHDHPHKHSHDHSHEHHHDHDEHGHDHEHGSSHSSCSGAESSCCHAPQAPILDLHNVPVTTDTQAVYRIQNMDCPTEESLIRKKLAQIGAIKKLEFNLMQRILTVHHDHADLDQVEKALQEIDMQPEPILHQDELENHKVESSVNWLKLGVAGLLALVAEVIEFSYGDHWSVLVFALLAIILGGLGTYKKGWIALKNLNLNMNALMSFAVTGALLIGQWPEAAMVMVLFTLAEAIEAKSMDRARNAIEKLLKLTPEQATVQSNNGEWVKQEVKQILVDSLIRVKPGERIPLDGIIVNGQSTVDQAPITGESLPVDKVVGDSVFAGTINQSGSFEYKVTALASNSTIARIIHAVEDAQSKRAPTQRFVDQFAKVYTPIVFIIALGLGIIPPIMLGEQWLPWIYKALVLLVIACPCALVISTPVTIVSGLASATRYGILIKGGNYLELGRKLKWLALDKTGTITYGKPKQTDCIILGALEADKIEQIATSLAMRSDHPVSQAITEAGKKSVITPLAVEEFTAILGQGTYGIINDEKWYLGNYRLVTTLNFANTALEQQVVQLEQQGKSVVMIINASSGVQAIIAVADTVKESSIEAIKQLALLNVKTMMLTGDNDYTAQTIAKQVNVNDAKGNLLPEDKLNEVSKLTAQGVVGMVGDGINDAPALAKADIGFAMGAVGTDTAIETADVALMDDDLRKIPQFIKLSKATYAILVQNIVFALMVKFIFFTLTFMGDTTMWMAVFADIGTSLLVVANGLRILRK